MILQSIGRAGRKDISFTVDGNDLDDAVEMCIRDRMRTGEGKTLVATLPSYLNALEGKGVHVVTAVSYTHLTIQMEIAHRETMRQIIM